MGTRTKHQQQPKAQLVVADGGLVVAGDDVDEEGMVDVKVIDDGVVLDADEEQGMWCYASSMYKNPTLTTHTPQMFFHYPS